MSTSRDQMVGAWLEITNHPLWEDCFGSDDSLKESMLAKMDRLYGSEVDGNQPCTEDHGHLASYGKGSTIELLDRPMPPLPTTPGTVFRATEIRGKKCDVIVMVCEWRALVTYASSIPVAKQTAHNAYNITAWEPIEAVQ